MRLWEFIKQTRKTSREMQALIPDSKEMIDELKEISAETKPAFATRKPPIVALWSIRKDVNLITGIPQGAQCKLKMREGHWGKLFIRQGGKTSAHYVFGSINCNGKISGPWRVGDECGRNEA